MKLFTCIYILLFNFSVLANTLSFKNIEGDNYIITHNNSGKWTVDHFVVPYGKLQELKSSLKFSTKMEANIYINEKFSVVSNLKSIFIPSPTITTESEKVIWEVENQWTLEWEDKFAVWVDENLSETFYYDNNIATDCADAAYVARWIFARIHKLPAAGTLAGSRVVFTQDSFKDTWNNLSTDDDWSKDELFRTALDYLTEHVYTGTLVDDGYPIKINKEMFREGTVWLEDGHTYFVADIHQAGEGKAPIHMLNSTVPKRVRKLSRTTFMEEEGIEEEIGGFLHFRWPVKINDQWKLTPKIEMPQYSLEQYDEDFAEEYGSFALTVINKIGITFMPKTMIRGALNSINTLISDRIQIVKDGFNYCKDKTCEYGSQDYENWSTPSRDKRILTKFKEANKMALELSRFDESVKNWWFDLIKKQTITINNKRISLLRFMKLADYDFISHHPKSSLVERWGFDNEAVITNLKNKVVRKKKLLKLKLTEGSTVCADLTACGYDSENWQKWNTFAISKFFSELEGKISKYCKSNKGFCDIFKTDYNYDAFISQFSNEQVLLGNPLLPLNFRKGDHLKTAYTFSNVNTLQGVNDNYMIVDEKLYDLNIRSYVDLGDVKRLDYLPKLDKIAVFGNSLKKFSLRLLDPTDLSESASINFKAKKGYNFFINRSKLIGEDFVLNECKLYVEDEDSEDEWAELLCNYIPLEITGNSIVKNKKLLSVYLDEYIENSDGEIVGMSIEYGVDDESAVILSSSNKLKTIEINTGDSEYVEAIGVLDNYLLLEAEVEDEECDEDSDDDSDDECEIEFVKIVDIDTNEVIAKSELLDNEYIDTLLTKDFIQLYHFNANMEFPQSRVYKINNKKLELYKTFESYAVPLRSKNHIYLYDSKTKDIFLIENSNFTKFKLYSNESVISFKEDKFILSKDDKFIMTDFNRTFSEIIETKFGVPKFCMGFGENVENVRPCSSESNYLLSFTKDLTIENQTFELSTVATNPIAGKLLPVADKFEEKINDDDASDDWSDDYSEEDWENCETAETCMDDSRSSKYTVDKGSLINTSKKNFLYIAKPLN